MLRDFDSGFQKPFLLFCMWSDFGPSSSSFVVVVMVWEKGVGSTCRESRSKVKTSSVITLL